MTANLDYKKKQQSEILERLKSNVRVTMIRVAAPKDCNVGATIQGVYTKEKTPELPFKGCSRAGGCICAYEPVLNDIFP
ncbi:MAG: hypothetical protein N2D54_01690 [Chloroflexota bacterium]